MSLSAATYVYVIACFGKEPGENFELCKVGVAKSPGKRLAELQTGSPFYLEIAFQMAFPDRAQAMKVEREFHNRHRRSAEIGEWFRLHYVDASIEVCRIAAGSGFPAPQADLDHLIEARNDMLRRGLH